MLAHPDLLVHADADKEFEDRGSDWGFSSFAEHRQLLPPNTGFIVDSHLTVQVKMDVQSPTSVLEAAKKQTGFVGLKNQGATCYMNSLLQTLYNINIFRQASTNVVFQDIHQSAVNDNLIPLLLFHPNFSCISYNLIRNKLVVTIYPMLDTVKHSADI